ncbi:transglutaminase domain-containing protein [Kibdelosporangium aridum]|uniref:Transglutaminase domain-containing protein n=1 Tax=Kibdelosporangium aridum TaxID=2030 RepID=A0A428ZR03_KIBAR|nr:transglutaminase domain-containing protein [Kibdelosporangium aridum]
MATLGASLIYGQFFASTEYLLPLCIASFGGALIAAIQRRSLAKSTLAACAGFIVLAIYGVFADTVQYGAPSNATATELFWGVVGGWARMLTVGLPVDVRGDLLITPVLIAWIAAFTGTTLATRTHSALAPIGPPLAAFAIALLFVGDRPGTHIIATTVFLAGALSLVLLRANQSALRYGIPVVIVVAALAIGAGLITPLSRGENRFDPRDLHKAPLWIADTLTPLAEIKSQLGEQPPRRLFTVRTDAPIDRVRTSTLNDYDGTLWRSADQFVVAGRQLSDTEGPTVAAHIEIDNLKGPFLPVIGQPATLDLTVDDITKIGFSEDSGVLATTEAAPKGLRYTIVGSINPRGNNPRGDQRLHTATPSATSLPLPNGLPPQLRALAQQLTLGDQTPYAKLLAIETYLRRLPYNIDAQPGHSYGALTRILTATDPADAASYAEQHAAAFAVLARALGFHTRVAVGYRLPANGSVTTNDAHAWAEVAFDGFGWIPFEPTDVTSKPTEPRTQMDSPVAGPPPPNPPLAAPPAEGPKLAPSGEPGSGWGEVLRTTAVVAVSFVSFLALLTGLIVAEKARRRWRRRRARNLADRVLGAWDEATDRLIERGATFAVSTTFVEAAERVTGLAALAPLATAAVFAPDHVTNDDVRQAWQLEKQLRGELSPRLSPRSLRARLSPRPLLAGWRDSRATRRNLRQLGVS